MLKLIIIYIILVVFTYFLLTIFSPSKHLKLRLERIAASSQKQEKKESFYQRVIKPPVDNIADMALKITPLGIKTIIEQKIAKAGYIKLTCAHFIVILLISALFFSIAIGVISLKLVPTAAILYTFAGTILGLLLPLLVLNQKILKRQKTIVRSLPDILDLLTVSVEAGLTFDGALLKMAKKMKGCLVDEFLRALKEMEIGISKREALTNLGARCDVAELSLFISSLIQADQLGVSLSNVLKIQSASLREKRRQIAEEKAMKAPIKIMIPLIFCIFPTIFAVLLGPALLQMIDLFL